jgi:hypothetical protein
MKLLNSTDWQAYFLRRMVAWCCRQIGLPVRKLRQAQFRNRTTCSYSGHAYGRRIVCSIGPDLRFPTKPDGRDGMANEVIADRTEALIAITAHELEHVSQFHSGRDDKLKGRCEASTRAVEVRVLRLFRANREALLAEWSVLPAVRDKPAVSIQDKRSAKAAADLARWQRKLKLAQTKCRKLKQRVSYYDKALAASRGQK